MSQSRMTIGFACNRWQDGSPRGKVSSVEVRFRPGVSLELDITGWPEPPFTYHAERRVLVFLGRHWPIRSYQTWVGNWCWDEVSVDPLVGLQMLRAMRADGRFGCTGGAVFLGNWFGMAPAQVENSNENG